MYIQDGSFVDASDQSVNGRFGYILFFDCQNERPSPSVLEVNAFTFFFFHDIILIENKSRFIQDIYNNYTNVLYLYLGLYYINVIFKFIVCVYVYI